MKVKNFSFSVFNVVSVFLVILIFTLILLPFRLINLEQAQRIAKWKSDFEQLKYCFALVNLHEGSIVPTSNEKGEILSEEFMLNRIKPYLNLSEQTNPYIKKYKYKKKNGRSINKSSQFYFDKFFTGKDGAIYSIKANNNYLAGDEPLFFMLIDVNGLEKPNKIGQDIFFLNIYQHDVYALGHGKTHAKLKSNCSPIAGGFFCSEYYLYGGRF